MPRPKSISVAVGIPTASTKVAVIMLFLVAATGVAQGALTATAIQWVQGNDEIPHPALNGKPTMLQAIAEGGDCAGAYRYRWDWNGDGDFADANEGFRAANSNSYFARLGLDVQYPDAAGDRLYFPKVEVQCSDGSEATTATMPVLVRVDRICPAYPANNNCTADQNLDLTRRVNSNRAVDRALWYMFGTFSYDTSGGVERCWHPELGQRAHRTKAGRLFGTGQTVNAFLRRGHGHGAGRDSDPYYRHMVKCGVDNILSHLTYGDVDFADTNQNGVGGRRGLFFDSWGGSTLYSYTSTSWVEPIAMFGNPDYAAPLGEASGQSLSHIGQDMADTLIHCQNNGGSWHYDCNQAYGNDTQMDGSTNGWPVEALRLLRRRFGTETYAWAQDRQRAMLNSSSNSSGCRYGSFKPLLAGNCLTGYGWTENEDRNSGAAAKIGDLLRAAQSVNYKAEGSMSGGGLYYMYALTKGMRAFSPELKTFPNGVDWSQDYTDFLLKKQSADGSFPWDPSYLSKAGTGYGSQYGKNPISTQIIQTWLESVAFARAFPELSGPGIDITFDHSWSYVLDHSVTLATFKWNVVDYPRGLDLNGDGAFDGAGEHPPEDTNGDGVVDLDEMVWEFETNDLNEPFVYAYTADLDWGEVETHQVTLAVVDSAGRVVTDTDSVTVKLSLLNHVPVIIGHPDGRGALYRGYIGTDILMDGRESYDLDTQHPVFPGDNNRPVGIVDRITSIHFDLNLDGDFDDAGEDGTDGQVRFVPQAGMAVGDRIAVPIRVCDDGQWNGECYDGVTRADCSECAFGSAAVQVVQNVEPPQIDVGQNPYVWNLADPVQFDLSGTRDPEGVLGITYTYELITGQGTLSPTPGYPGGDGDWGPNPTYVPDPDGLRTDVIRATATDFAGLASQAEIRVTVPNMPPVLDSWEVTFEALQPTVQAPEILALGNGWYEVNVPATPSPNLNAWVHWAGHDPGGLPITGDARAGGDYRFPAVAPAGISGPFLVRGSDRVGFGARVSDGQDIDTADAVLDVPAADPSLSYYFDLGNDGTYEVTGSGQSTFRFQAPAGQNGIVLAGYVRGAGGEAVSFEQQVQFVNGDPVFEIARVLSKTGFDVVITAGAADPDGDDITYTVDWGDGQQTQMRGGIAAHTYPEQYREYTIRVTANDGRGGSASRDLAVDFPAPAANRRPRVLELRAIDQGDFEVLVVATATDPDGDQLNYTIGWGDGSPDTQTGNGVAAHQYPAGRFRQYQILLTVDDGRGGSAVRATNINFPAPAANTAPVVGELQISGQGDWGVSLVIGAVDADGDTLSYSIDWGDGSPIEQTPASVAGHVYPANRYRNYRITVTVRDGNGGSAVARGEYDFPAPAANTAPVIEQLQITRQGNWGLNLVVGAADADGDPLNYVVDWGDGTLTRHVAGVAFHVYPEDVYRRYTLQVRVEDGRGGSDTAQTFVVFAEPAANIAPVIESLQVVRQGDWDVSLVVGAADADGDALSYTIDWGDGSEPTRNGAGVAAHRYPVGVYRLYPITVQVEDGRGGTTQDSTSVDFPTPDANRAPAIEDLQVVKDVDTFAASVVVGAVDPDGDALTYRIDWGDGSEPTVNGAGVANHAYARNVYRTYSLTVTVEDGRGGSVEGQADVAFPRPAANRAPTIEQLQATRVGNWAVDLVVGAVDPDGDQLLFTIDWGDDSEPTENRGGIATHLYAEGVYQQYQITVTVTDGRGGLVDDRVMVEFPRPAANVAPVLEPLRVIPEEGFQVLVVAAAADADDDPLTYTFDWGDDSPATVNRGGLASHAFPENVYVTYVVRVTVEDGRGGVDSADIEVDFPAPVVNQPPVINDISLVFGARGLGTLAVTAVDPEGSRLVYRVNWGDEPVDTDRALLGGVGSHRYELPAEGEQYRGWVMVRDAHGNETRAEFPADVADNPTVISEFTISLINAGTVLVNVVAEDRDGNDFLVYSFDFDDDGSFEVNNQANPSIVHSFAEAGLHPIRVRVRDTWSGTETDGVAQIDLAPWVGENAQPVITTVQITNGPRGEVQLVVDAFDPEGGRLDYEILWGDEEGEAARQPLLGGSGTHTYPFQEGPYGAMVWVSDSAGSTTSRLVRVDIVDHPTRIRQVAGSLIREGTMLFTVLAEDGDGRDMLTYNFDFDGDGTWDVEDAQANSVAHTYPDPGSYTARFSVTDTWSGATVQDELDVVIERWVPDNTPPVINNVAVTINPRGQVAIVVDATDADGDRVDLVVHWGDEPNAEILAPLVGIGGQHAYAFDAELTPYLGWVRATDSRGASVQAVFEVVIEDLPTSIRQIDANLIRQGTMLFNVLADDGDGLDVLNYAFDFDGDGVFDVADQPQNSTIFAYDTPGLNLVTVRVTDTWSGRSVTDTLELNVPDWRVENRPPVIHEVFVQMGIRGLATLVVNASDPDGGRVEAVLHFGDEQDPEALAPMPGLRIEHRYPFLPDGELYRGWVEVTDAVGASVTAQFEVQIIDAPTVIRDCRAELVREGTYLLQILADDADGDDLLVYSFDFEGDGTFDAVDELQNSVVHTYPRTEERTVICQVTDTWSGRSVEARTTFGQPGGDGPGNNNLAPVIDAVRLVMGPGGEATLAVDARDPEGGVLSLQVHFGDEDDANAAVAVAGFDVSHTYPFAIDAPYAGFVIVTDAAGAESTADFEALVIDSLTVIRSISSADLGSGRVRFAVVADDADTDELTYSYDFDDDGTFDVIDVRESSPVQQFDVAGEYTIQVRVRDGWSGAEVTEAHTFKLDAWVEPPVLPERLETTEGVCVVFRIGEDATFETKVDPAVCERDSNPGEALWKWQFGDGTTARGTEVGHRYVDDGVFDIVIDGGTPDRPLRSNIQIFVGNAAPQFASQAPVIAERGRAFTYAVSLTDAGENDALQLELIEAPEGMALVEGIDDRNWVLTWSPSADLPDRNVSVGLRAFDGRWVDGDWIADGGETTQRFVLTLTGTLDDNEPGTPETDPPVFGTPDAGVAGDAGFGADAFTGSSCNCDLGNEGSGTPALLVLAGLLLIGLRRRRR